VLVKTFTEFTDASKSRFTRNTPYAPKTQDTLPVLSEMVAFKDPLTIDIGCPSNLGSSFVIEIQTHARRIELERIC